MHPIDRSYLCHLLSLVKSSISTAPWNISQLKYCLCTDLALLQSHSSTRGESSITLDKHRATLSNEIGTAKIHYQAFLSIKVRDDVFRVDELWWHLIDEELCRRSFIRAKEKSSTTSEYHHSFPFNSMKNIELTHSRYRVK